MGTGATLNFCGETVEEKKEMKVLGVVFDRGGTGVQHCKGIAAKAMSRVNLLRRLRGQTWGTNAQRLLQFYKQFVRPVMENGYAYSANAKPSAIQHLQVVQNSALRVVLKADRRTRITDMHRETGLELLQDRLNHLKVNASGRYKDSFLIHLLETRKSALGVI